METLTEKKIAALRVLQAEKPDTGKNWPEDAIERLSAVKSVRQIFVHGFASGTTDDDPQKLVMRLSTFDKDEAQTEQLSINMKELEKVVDEVRDLAKASGPSSDFIW